jgi:hypothetical protein
MTKDVLTSIWSEPCMFGNEFAAKALDMVPQRLVGCNSMQPCGPSADSACVMELCNDVQTHRMYRMPSV